MPSTHHHIVEEGQQQAHNHHCEAEAPAVQV